MEGVGAMEIMDEAEIVFDEFWGLRPVDGVEARGVEVAEGVVEGELVGVGAG